MEQFQEPKDAEIYNKCKYIVKLWEHNFTKQHKRVPSKLDIKEANHEVKSAYKKYFQLKSSLLEQSFKDVDGFNSDDDNIECNVNHKEIDENSFTTQNSQLEIIDNMQQNSEDVWNVALDKKVVAKVEKEKSSSNLNSSFAQKLFSVAKSSKRPIRKSLKLLPSRKSENINETTKDDSPVTDCGNFNKQTLDLDVVFQENSFRIVEKKTERFSQPTNIVQSILNNEYKSVKTVDSGWVERINYSTGIQMSRDDDNESLHYSSDDIIDNSDEETTVPCAKKFKFDSPSSQNIKEDSNVQSLNTKTVVNKENKEINIDKVKENIENIALSEIGNDINVKIVEEDIDWKPEQKPKKATATNKTKNSSTPKNTTKRGRKKKTPKSDSDSDSEAESKPRRQSRSKPSNKIEKKVRGRPPNQQTKKLRSSKKSDNLPKSEETVERDDDNTSDYELEFSIKTRKSAPRVSNLRDFIKDKVKPSKAIAIKSDSNKQLASLENKIKTGNLNENYRTINLKKKVFVRGKKNMNFSRYKKKQWRSKKKANEELLRMDGCDGGQFICFSCGEPGHFAQNCPKGKAERLLPASAVEEDEDVTGPTLEEAAEMAKSNKTLVVRPPTMTESQVDQGVDDVENSEQDSIFDDLETNDLLAETLRLEDIVTKLDLEKYLDSKQTIAPCYDLNEDGSVIDTPPEVFEALEKFGYSSFRAGQEEAVMRILSGKSTLVTLSTGSGKSLCYQLPAYLYYQKQRCISLIISPLVSLMEDQVTGLPKFLKAACLHTNKTKVQRAKILEEIESGDLSILLVSPEAVISGERSSWFGSFLRKLPPIAFACIDEAHCVSHWSHNFRPSYLMICRVLRERIGISTILGLTATATTTTMSSIVEHLQITDGENGVIRDIPVPNNLNLTVSRDHQRDQALLALITSEKLAECRSIIIYCTRREECNRIAHYLRTSLQFCRNNSNNSSSSSKKRKRVEVEVEPYHAGLAGSRRKTIQKKFMSNQLRIVVATVAFGMGINKPDIRSVIHYNMPKNFESYVQEIGRAGRDGLPAHCHLFLDPNAKDEIELRRHIYANSIERHIIRKLLQKVFVPCSCKGICPKHEVAFSINETVQALDLAEENIQTLLCYLELHKNKYLELLSPAYIYCKVISYAGTQEIKKAAKECPPLAMAFALHSNQLDDKKNVLEFNVIDIASAIGWDSGICKHKLKNLEWTAVNGQPRRSKLNVQFTNLGFRMLAPGNLTPDQLDEALDNLYNKVTIQEKTSLLQLRAIYQTLSEMAEPNYRSCLREDSNNEKLKLKIREFFQLPDPLSSIQLSECGGGAETVNEDLIINNIRGLICAYRDNNFTGRAVARVFHGIASPNYPAFIWGRSKYWRCMINVDFHLITKLANKEILSYK